MSGNEPVRVAQSFAYEIREDSAVILRCFSRAARVEIPEQIGGYPVTELGAYAFSAHFEEEKLSEALRAGRARLYVPESLKFGLESGFRWRGISQPSASEPLKSGPEGTEQSSESEDETTFQTGGNVVASTLREDGLAGIALPPALCGPRLEEIALPPTVRRVGRYCFYNCANLRRIEFHGELSDWGSGAFTGCHGVKSLRVYTDADGRSHLKDVLDELREELEVEYFTEGRDAIQTEGGYAGDPETGYADDPEAGPVRLIFPEFYEEGVENTPARILETHVHGSGILYRNCFQGRAFDFTQYDVLFPHAKAWESGELVLRMALWRLRVPQGLTREAKEQYGSYLAEHAEEAGKWLLGQRDLDGVRFLLELVRARQLRGRTALKAGDSGEAADKEGETLRGTLESALFAEASRIQYMEAVSFLMERHSANRSGRPARRRRLEL